MGYAIGVWGWRRAIYLRVIPILLLVTFVAQMFMFYWAFEYKNNALIAHIFNPIQFSLLMVFFYQNYKESKEKKVTLFIGIAMFFYALINSFFLQNTKTLPSNFLVVSNFLLIVFSVNLFLQKLDTVSTKENIFKEPVFLIAMGILSFNIFSFLFFLLHNYLINHNISTKSLSNILVTTNVFYYSIILIALIFSSKNSINARAKI